MLPFKSCPIDNDLDVLIIVGGRYKSAMLFKERLMNIVSYVLKIRHAEKTKCRVAVIDIVSMKTIIHFSEIERNSSIAWLLDTVVQNPIHDYEESDEDPVPFIMRLWKDNWETGAQRLTIWLVYTFPWYYEKNKDQSPEIRDLSSSTEINLFVIISYGHVSHTKSQDFTFFSHNVIHIDENDSMNFAPMMHFKICGQCPEECTLLRNRNNPVFVSCYKFIDTESSINYREASQICSNMKSSLVNVETKEEMDFVEKMFTIRTNESNQWIASIASHRLKKILTVNITESGQWEVDSSGFRIPTGLVLFRDNKPFRYQWLNRRPFILGTGFLPNRFDHNTSLACVSLNVNYNYSDKNITNKIFLTLENNYMNEAIYNRVLCEVSVLENLSIYSEFTVDGDLLDTSKKVIDTKFLFDCEGNDQHILYNEVCDGYVNCHSKLDEEFYNDEIYCKECMDKMCNETCLPSQWFGKSNMCIELKFKNDTTINTHSVCIDDDCLRTFEYHPCIDQYPQEGQKEWAPKCIYLRGRSGYPLGCPDLAHLDNCENFTCPDDMVKCPFSYCIQAHYVGDKIMDCRFGEDESFKQCLYSNCAFVDNMAEADAVIFSGSSIRDNNMPLRNRTKGQRWIMYTYDPAVKDYGLGRDEVRSHFNMTMTYQLDSDFPLIFGQLKRRKLPDKDYDVLYDNKTNHTAWFVSHCTTWGRREVYVERMKKLMDVDIFGGCSDRRCGVIHYRRSDSTLCLPMLTRHYKFYLSFENSFCKDYLTEKFFKLFQDVDIIPVVRGGFDYKKYLPSGIFVNAADFKGPEELAQYLNRLAANKTEYVRMLKRKNRWFERWSTSFVCSVCEALHTTENKTLIIRNLRSRFNGNPSFCWNAKDLGN
ncbi:hypothetical protein Btru_007142 [Bulinus truncatus]|nr:hypothetical protein Btru_007142 [Bulinus truncatus]